MIKRKLFVTVLLFVVFAFFTFSLSSGLKNKKLPHFNDNVDPEILAQQIVDAMTNEELLAQTLMFGWAGQDPSWLVIDWVEKRSLGSIKVFGWNTDNTEKVAEAILLLQKKSTNTRFGIPLFVATDQEGGWIRHIKGKTSETPGNLAIGASSLPDDAWNSGYYIARELSALGINLNFAPTIDLFTDHNSSVIGPRSFGENPELVSILGAAFMAGSHEAGVLTTAKHFPGHGDTHLDSHGNLPVINISEKILFERELIPFIKLINAGVPAIMSGHLSFPLITKDGEPATFSTYFLKDLLREKLGFTGLVITDDIMMNGATQWAGNVSKAVELALRAGNDIVESSTTPSFNSTLWTRNINLMNESKSFKNSVYDAAKRIVYTKLVYFKSKNSVPVLPNLDEIDSKIPDKEGEGYFLSLAVRSTTILKNKIIPLDESVNDNILIASNYSNFLSEGQKRFPNAKVSNINNNLVRTARFYDAIIVSLTTENDLLYIGELEPYKDKLIVVSLLSPVLLQKIPWVTTSLAIYSYAPVSFKAAFAAIKGDFIPTGELPLVDFP